MHHRLLAALLFALAACAAPTPIPVDTAWVTPGPRDAQAPRVLAVVAHPGKYGFTTTKLRALLSDFVKHGGAGIEVVCGQQEASLTRRLAILANDFDLLASTGSDFHHPGNSWSQPGLFATLPDNVTGIWERWTTSSA